MIKKENIFSFFFFSGSKSVVFFTPLAVLWLFGDSYYVLVEQIFATSLTLWPMLGLGMTSVYGYFFLGEKNQKFTCFYRHYLLSILIIVVIIFSVSLAFLGHNNELSYTFFIVSVMCFSYFTSTTYKCRNDVVRSSFFDVLPYIAFFVVLNIAILYDFFSSLLMFAIMFFIGFSVFTQIKKNERTRYTFSDVKQYFVKGIFSFIVSWVAIFVVMFPRISVVEFGTLEESSALYFTLRFGMFFVLISQFLQIKMYSRLFQISIINITKLLVSFWLGVLLLLIILMFLDLPILFYYVALYTAMWIMIATLELQVIRHNAQKYVINRVLFTSPILLLFFLVNDFVFFLCFSIILLNAYLICQTASIYTFKTMCIIMMMPILSSFGMMLYI